MALYRIDLQNGADDDDDDCVDKAHYLSMSPIVHKISGL
jgi:hypothetical protein